MIHLRVLFLGVTKIQWHGYKCRVLSSLKLSFSVKPMKTSPSMKDLLMQLQLHRRCLKAETEEPSPSSWDLPQLHPTAKQAAFLRCHCPPPAAIQATHGHCVQFTSLLPLIFQNPLAAGLRCQTPPEDRLSHHGCRHHHTTHQAPTRFSLWRSNAGRAWVRQTLPPLPKPRCWTQDHCLGSGQKWERDEHPTWCFTSGV